MNSEFLSIAAMVCFALGAAASIRGIWWNLSEVTAFRNMGYQALAVAAGILLKTAAIGVACSTKSNHFFSSGSEIFGLLAWALACSYMLVLVVSGTRSLGALILPFVVALLIASLLGSRESRDPGVTPDTLFATHILSAFLGYGLFLTACGASVLYLEQARLLKRKTFGALFKDLPSLERLERLELLCAWLGLAVFTIAIATGAKLAGGNAGFWLEPKIIATGITWLIFGTFILGRAIRFLHGRTAAKFVLAGAVVVALTFALSHPSPKKTAESKIQSPKSKIISPGALA